MYIKINLHFYNLTSSFAFIAIKLLYYHTLKLFLNQARWPVAGARMVS